MSKTDLRTACEHSKVYGGWWLLCALATSGETLYSFHLIQNLDISCIMTSFHILSKSSRKSITTSFHEPLHLSVGRHMHLTMWDPSCEGGMEKLASMKTSKQNEKMMENITPFAATTCSTWSLLSVSSKAKTGPTKDSHLFFLINQVPNCCAPLHVSWYSVPTTYFHHKHHRRW